MKYLIKTINDYNEDEIISFYNKINNFKKDKIDKYKNNKLKLLSIIGEILLKDLLLDLYNLNYSNLDFNYNNYGKSYIKDKDIYFNISHSFDYIITIVSNKEIGIDIEKVRKTNLNTINYFATNKEKEYILKSNNDIEKRLFQIYTLKEAYFKMKGTNLNNIFSVEFIIKNNKVYCSDKTVECGFINDIDNYIISYCKRK